MLTRGVTFDYGGTLDGVASHWLDRFVGFYVEAGVEVPFAEVKNAFYRADRAAEDEPALRDAGLASLMEFHVNVQLRELGLGTPGLHRFLVERFVSTSRAALQKSRAFLAGLAGPLRIGVVSNFYGNVETILEESGIASLLDVIVDSTIVGVRKPDPRIYELAARRLELAPTEMVHVGDSYERDVLAARSAGFRTVWLAGPERAVPAERAAELCLRQLEDLPSLLETDGL